MNGEKFTGRIKFFSGMGRYGFIIRDPDGQEIYFKEKDCHRSITHLEPGDFVEFNTIHAMKGPRGVNIRLVSKEESKEGYGDFGSR